MEEVNLIYSSTDNTFVYSKITLSILKISYSTHKANSIKNILTQINNLNNISQTTTILFTMIRSSSLYTTIKQFATKNGIRIVPLNKRHNTNKQNVSHSLGFLNLLQYTEESVKPSNLDYSEKHIVTSLYLAIAILFFVLDTRVLDASNKTLLSAIEEYIVSILEQRHKGQTQILNTNTTLYSERKITLLKKESEGYLIVPNQTLYALSIKKKFRDTIITNITPLYKTEYYLPYIFYEQLMLKSISSKKLQTKFIQPSLNNSKIARVQEAVLSLQMNPSVFNELKTLFKKNINYIGILTLKINEELKLEDNIIKRNTHKNWFNLQKVLVFSVNLILLFKNFPIILNNLDLDFIERLSYITKNLTGLFKDKYKPQNKNHDDKESIVSEFLLSKDIYNVISNTTNKDSTTKLEELSKKFSESFNQLIHLKTFLNTLSQPKLNPDVIKVAKDVNCTQYNFIYIPQFGFYVLFPENNRAYKMEICKKLDEEIGDLYTHCIELQEAILSEIYAIFIYPHLYNTIRKVFKFIIKCDLISAITNITDIRSYAKCDIQNNNDKNIRINMASFGHPLIETEYCIKNDIGLKGGDVVVIGGPNGSGKTTWAKSILSNIILSYSTGFGNFISCKLGSIKSLYSVIPSSTETKNIKCFKDDLIAIRKVIEEISNGSEGSVYFIDEFGKGTDPIDGASLLCSVVNHISQLNTNNIFIFVTNFLDTLPVCMFSTKVKLLEMKTEVTKDENKDLIFKYKTGKYEKSNFGGLSIAKLFFEDDIMSRAEQIKTTYESRVNDENSQQVGSHGTSDFPDFLSL